MARPIDGRPPRRSHFTLLAQETHTHTHTRTYAHSTSDPDLGVPPHSYRPRPDLASADLHSLVLLLAPLSLLLDRPDQTPSIPSGTICNCRDVRSNRNPQSDKPAPVILHTILLDRTKHTPGDTAHRLWGRRRRARKRNTGQDLRRYGRHDLLKKHNPGQLGSIRQTDLPWVSSWSSPCPRDYPVLPNVNYNRPRSTTTTDSRKETNLKGVCATFSTISYCRTYTRSSCVYIVSQGPSSVTLSQGHFL